MRKIVLPALLVLSVAACKKDDTTPNNNNNNNNNNPTGCTDGNVCHKLNGADISKPGGGYIFADTFTFVKYEDGAKQLSIDIFGNTAGAYTVGDVRKKGNGRIYYFPDANTQYMSAKGNLNLTELTSDRKATGTFSGILYKYDANTSTFTMTDSMVITNGSFTKVQLSKL